MHEMRKESKSCGTIKKQTDNIIKASQRLAEFDFNIERGGLKINVLWFRAMRALKGGCIARHRHFSFEIHVITEGSCILISDGGEQKITKGQMYITAPGIYHEQYAEYEDYVEYCLNCDLSAGRESSRSARRILEIYGGIGIEPVKYDEDIKTLFELAFSQVQHGGIGFCENIEALVYVLINRVAAEYDNGAEVCIEERKSNINSVRFEKIDRYIRDNIASPIKISDVSEILYLSTKQVGRIVRAYTSMSTKEYIMHLKLEKAKEYLRHGELSVSAAAENLGFSSVQHFVRFFSEKEGCTPTKFRLYASNVRKI